MRSRWPVVLLFFAVAILIQAQQGTTRKSDVEKVAIVNLRKLAMAESAYAMGHEKTGFACDPQELTKLAWPGSPTHAPLVDPKLLSGEGGYKFSARCVGNSKPAGKLNVFAVPLDAQAGLRTFCASGSFQTAPFKATSEFPIRVISSGDEDSCLKSGKPLS